MTPPAKIAAKLICVIGPTASGKSDLAVAIAERIGGELLSFDSMQVYREMDIGTAKPTADERRRVVHHGIDLVGPDETFTVARFTKVADDTIADADARGVPLVLVGGTPLYFKSIFDGLFDGPASDPASRDGGDVEDAASLHAQLAAVDPVAAGRLHRNDTRRVRRALEVHAATGKTISELQTEWASGRRRYDAVWLGLRWDTEPLNRRINARVKAMIAAGWLEETRRLLERFGALSPTASMAAGYTLLGDVVRGTRTLDDAIEQIKIRTRQLARRQMKWFRRFADVHWLEADADAARLLAQALAIVGA